MHVMGTRKCVSASDVGLTREGRVLIPGGFPPRWHLSVSAKVFENMLSSNLCPRKVRVYFGGKNQ